MPYITQDERRHYDSALNLIVNRLSQRAYAAGDLTYVLYAIAVRVSRDLEHELGYAGLSRVRASLSDATDEFYRAEIAPYEDRKIDENGAV